MVQQATPQIFDRELLLRRRLRAAHGNAPPDFLLARVAADFADRLTLIKRAFPRVLNLTAATGALGRTLADVRGIHDIVNTELAPELAGPPWPATTVADEEALPFPPATFDLVVSALTLQFVNDLPGTLTQIRRLLKPDGLFLGAMVGGETLKELRQATLQAEVEVHDGASPRVAPLADVRDLGALLQRAGFALPVADADTLTVSYATPLDLMRELKAMAAGNVLIERSRKPMTRRLLLRIAEIYAERYAGADGRIPATFETLTMTGWAPDDSQPKPLRPGSATTRLADALGTNEITTGDPAVPGDRTKR